MASTRRLAAILAADVAGYSRLMGFDEEGTHERLKAHFQQLVEPKIKEYQGRVVKNTGDGVLVEFPSVVERCAAPPSSSGRCSIARPGSPTTAGSGSGSGSILAMSSSRTAISLATASMSQRAWRRSPSLAAYAFRGQYVTRSATDFPISSKIWVSRTSRTS